MKTTYKPVTLVLIESSSWVPTDKKPCPRVWPNIKFWSYKGWWNMSYWYSKEAHLTLVTVGLLFCKWLITWALLKYKSRLSQKFSESWLVWQWCRFIIWVSRVCYLDIMFGPVLYDVVDMAGIIDGDEQTPSGGKESKKKSVWGKTNKA